MPRIARSKQVIAHQPHHIWFRGNNRRRLFSYAHEYSMFLRFLREALIKTKVQLHSFSLLSNHGHLLLTPPNAIALSKCMQRTLHRYALHRNTRRKSSGKLFEERFGCKCIDDDVYLSVVHAYIDLNPWRAGLEIHFGDYPWCSAWFHLGLNRPRLDWMKKMCTPLHWFESLETTDTQRQEVYRRWLLECQARDVFEKLENKTTPSHPTVTVSVRRPNGARAIR